MFAERKAGGIREIFQDAAQDFDRSAAGIDYWPNHYPVNMILPSLFHHEDHDKHALFPDRSG